MLHWQYVSINNGLFVVAVSHGHWEAVFLLLLVIAPLNRGCGLS